MARRTKQDLEELSNTLYQIVSQLRPLKLHINNLEKAIEHNIEKEGKVT